MEAYPGFAGESVGMAENASAPLAAAPRGAMAHA
jgi:hypothetical protein